MFQMKMDREAPKTTTTKTTTTMDNGEASLDREAAGHNNTTTKRPSITAGMLQAAATAHPAWNNAYINSGDPNFYLSDTSLTDFLFDDDINLNEPLPLITSAGGAGAAGSGDPEEECSESKMLLQDSWHQQRPATSPPPLVIPLPANSSSSSAAAATATTTTTSHQQQHQAGLSEFSSMAHSSSSSLAAGGNMSSIFSSSSTTAAVVEPGGTPVSGPPSKNDVLLGRGGRNNQWSGNELLRTMAKFMADRYAQAQKRDKPGLAWILVTQMRQLDPPTRFLKQLVSSGEWFEVSDEVAKEKASQCLRDIVAAQTTGLGRKRAFQSAPELVNKRQRSLLQPDVPVGERQNASFNIAQLRRSGGPAPSNPFLGANNPFLAMMGGAGSRGPTSSSATRPLPPKAISCVSLGAAHRTHSSLTPSLSNSSRLRGSHQDPLLRQLHLLRAQQQQQNSMLQQQQSSANAQFPLPMMQQQPPPPPAIISQSNMMMQPQPTLPSRNFGTANATWDMLPRSSSLLLSREPPTEPMPYQTTCNSSGIASTTTAPANTIGGTNGIDMTDEDAALKRWIDRLAEEDF